MSHPTRLLLLALLLFSTSCTPTHPPAATRPILTRDAASERLRRSQYLAQVEHRLGGPEGLRFSFESEEPDGFVFWIYEDRETHAATIDRIKITLTGRLLVLDMIDYEWHEFHPSPLRPRRFP